MTTGICPPSAPFLDYKIGALDRPESSAASAPPIFAAPSAPVVNPYNTGISPGVSSPQAVSASASGESRDNRCGFRHETRDKCSTMGNIWL